MFWLFYLHSSQLEPFVPPEACLPLCSQQCRVEHEKNLARQGWIYVSLVVFTFQVRSFEEEKQWVYCNISSHMSMACCEI